MPSLVLSVISFVSYLTFVFFAKPFLFDFILAVFPAVDVVIVEAQQQSNTQTESTWVLIHAFLITH